MNTEGRATQQSTRRWGRGTEHGNASQAFFSLRQVIFTSGVLEQQISWR